MCKVVWAPYICDIRNTKCMVMCCVFIPMLLCAAVLWMYFFMQELGCVFHLWHLICTESPFLHGKEILLGVSLSVYKCFSFIYHFCYPFPKTFSLNLRRSLNYAWTSKICCADVLASVPPYVVAHSQMGRVSELIKCNGHLHTYIPDSLIPRLFAFLILWCKN